MRIASRIRLGSVKWGYAAVIRNAIYGLRYSGDSAQGSENPSKHGQYRGFCTGRVVNNEGKASTRYETSALFYSGVTA